MAVLAVNDHFADELSTWVRGHDVKGTRMDPETLAAQRAYERSLRELRQDIGCTPERLMDYPELFAALRERLTRQNTPDTVENCVAELKAVVGSLSDPKHREPLIVALRFNRDFSDSTVTGRRNSYNNFLKQSTDPETRRLRVDSVRTLERRENDGIERAAMLLAAKVETPVSPSTRHRLENSRIIESDQLIPEGIAYRCYLSELGSIRSLDVTRWVRARVRDATPVIITTHRYYSDRRRGVLKVQPTFGCRVESQEEDAAGGILVSLEIHARLSPEDGAYSFGYRIDVDSDVRSEPVLKWGPKAYYTKWAEIHLMFHPAMAPVRAWWFRSEYGVQGQIEPGPDEYRDLEILNDGRYVYRVFESEELARHLHYGVAWAWPMS